MGKIVKYCGVCDESFTEKFSFCPNCAAELDAYEMNPLMGEPENIEPVKVSEPANNITVEKSEEVTAPIIELPETQPVIPINEPAPPIFLNNFENNNGDEILEIEEEEVEEPIVTAPAVVIPSITEQSVVIPPVIEESVEDYQPVAKQSAEDYQQTYKANPFTPAQSTNVSTPKTVANAQPANDGFYNITFVEEKDGGKRNMFLLGAAVIVLGISVLSVIGSIYNADAFVGALDEDLNSVVYVPFDEPVDVIKEEPPPQKKEDDAGGGGGGNKDPNPVSKGRLADQSEKPMMAPSHTMDKVTNPTIAVKMETKGDKKFPPSDEKYGDPTSKYTVGSDGPGSGGGQGVGRGGGQGPGDGPGIGPGSGGGSGGGNRGGSRGRDDDDDPPPAAKPTGPTTALQITSKPRANYTDAARQAQVQGTVTLRVTFLASGQIGSISAVSGLPNGLTEQAIAAARSIRFEPAQKNGVKQTVVRQVQYTFTLY